MTKLDKSASCQEMLHSASEHISMYANISDDSTLAVNNASMPLSARRTGKSAHSHHYLAGFRKRIAGPATCFGQLMHLPCDHSLYACNVTARDVCMTPSWQTLGVLFATCTVTMWLVWKQS